MSRCRNAACSAHLGRRWTRSLSRSQPEQGSSTVEMVLLAPVLILLVLLVVFAGRLTQANTQVRHAADQAARAASLVSSSRMEGVGAAAALEELSTNGVACAAFQVTVVHASNGASESVTATVSCTVDRSQLAPLAPGTERVSASSTEIVDRRRATGAP